MHAEGYNSVPQSSNTRMCMLVPRNKTSRNKNIYKLLAQIQREEWALPVGLGSWANPSVRKMCIVAWKTKMDKWKWHRTGRELNHWGSGGHTKVASSEMSRGKDNRLHLEGWVGNIRVPEWEHFLSEQKSSWKNETLTFSIKSLSTRFPEATKCPSPHCWGITSFHSSWWHVPAKTLMLGCCCLGMDATWKLSSN